MLALLNPEVPNGNSRNLHSDRCNLDCCRGRVGQATGPFTPGLGVDRRDYWAARDPSPVPTSKHASAGRWPRRAGLRRKTQIETKTATNRDDFRPVALRPSPRG